jgi:hypothetical protein
MDLAKIQLRLAVKHRYITGPDDFLNIIKICMEFVERFPSLRSEQKKLIVVETVRDILRRLQLTDTLTYQLMIDPCVESFVKLSRSPLMINLRKNMFKIIYKWSGTLVCFSPRKTKAREPPQA